MDENRYSIVVCSVCHGIGAPPPEWLQKTELFILVFSENDQLEIFILYRLKLSLYFDSKSVRKPLIRSSELTMFYPGVGGGYFWNKAPNFQIFPKFHQNFRPPKKIVPHLISNRDHFGSKKQYKGFPNRFEWLCYENSKWQRKTVPHGSATGAVPYNCPLYTSPSPRDSQKSRMPYSAWKKQSTNPQTR